MRSAACVLAGLAVMAVAGCGSDDQPAAVTPTSEPTAASGAPSTSTTTSTTIVASYPDVDVSIVEDPGPPPADAPVPPDLPTCPPDCP